MEKLLLIDGNSMLFRAYYATVYGQAMSTNTGIPTNAIYGFAMMLQKAIKMIQPQQILVAFDHSKATYRHQQFPQYKANRATTPDDLKIQFPIIREYLEALHIVHFEKEGLEADDIIGSLAKQNSQYEVAILTSDKDLLQLVDERITVYLMQKGLTDIATMNPTAVYDRFQLQPLQIVDLKGLAGDPSDNIPGVTKVGDKTAIKLLTEYQSVEGVYQHIDEIKGKLQENLIHDQQLAFLSKRLATIITNADLSEIKMEDCRYQSEGLDAYQFYTKYQMKSLASKVDLSSQRKPQPASKETKTYQTKTFVEVKEVSPTDLIDQTAIYYEEDYISLINEKIAYSMSLTAFLQNKDVLAFLASEKVKIFYDIKSWHHLALKKHIRIEGRNIDLMIASFLTDAKVKSLPDLLSKYNLALEKQNTQLDLFETSNAKDKVNEIANKLWYLAEFVMAEIMQKQMSSLYYEVELPLAKILAEMEDTGILVDETVLDKIAAETSEKLQGLEQRIWQLAGKNFNINSPKQLAGVLYDDLKIARSTKRSTDAKVLSKYVELHPIIGEILEYRKYAKLYSTYAFGLKKYIQQNRIHTVFNQCVTETGRLSSSEPNLQNISIRNEEASMIRAAFIPDEGCVLVGADYSQVELRILAHLAQEKSMIASFQAGVDAHTKTAMDLFGVSMEEVTPLMRRQAKAINFGIDYGMSPFGLSETLKISVSQASEFIQSFFAKYPNIKNYMNQQIAHCQQYGYITTILNRRREIPEINSTNHNLKEFGKRAAMNAPVQGSAADLIKVAMIKVDQELKQRQLKSKLILQIHDELILNVPIEEKEMVMELVQRQMEQALPLSAPLKAEATFGDNWLEVK